MCSCLIASSVSYDFSGSLCSFHLKKCETFCILTIYEWIWIIVIIIYSSRALNRFCFWAANALFKMKVFESNFANLFIVMLGFGCNSIAFLHLSIFCTWNVLIFELRIIWIHRVQYSVSILRKLLWIEVFFFFRTKTNVYFWIFISFIYDTY